MGIERTKVNNCNFVGQLHGCWIVYYLNSEKIFSKTHYFNGQQVGTIEMLDLSGDIFFKCHYIDHEHTIGCYFENKTQRFYNKSDKLFGEDIAWK